MPNYLENDINVFELEGEISVGGGGTTNYEDLNNLPQINGVELKGNKTTEELGINIPTKTSDLNNDSGYVNSSIVANPYDSTSTYAVGAYVTHENNLYKCNTAITTAEEWNAEHWTLVDVISAIPTKTSELDNDSGFAVIDDTVTANDKAWSSGKIEGEINNLYPVATSSGTIVTFNNSLVKPFVSIKANIDYKSGGVSSVRVANISDTDKVTFFKGLLVGTYAFIKMDSLSWTKIVQTGKDLFRASVSSKALGYYNQICTAYPTITTSDPNGSSVPIGKISGAGISNNVYIGTTTDTYADADAFSTAHKNDYLIFELTVTTTPTLTQAQFETLCGAFNIGGNIAVIDTSGFSLYGGYVTLTPTSATLTSTKNADGTDKVTPDIYTLSGVSDLLVLSGRNNVFCGGGDVGECVYYCGDIFINSPLQYKVGNDSIEILQGYGDKNLLVSFDKHGGNNIFDFAYFYTVNSSLNIEDITESDKTLLQKVTTDWHSPYQDRAVNNIDGDNKTGGSYNIYFTGGNHQYNNTGSGSTPTGRTTTIKFFANGKEVKNGAFGFADNIRIDWINRVQGYNTTKVDGSGREIIEEHHTMFIDGEKFEDYNKITALEDVTIINYYGLSYSRPQAYYPNIRYVGATNKGIYTGNIASDSGNLTPNELVAFGANDKMIIGIDNEYDLGRRDNLSGGTSGMFVTTSNKGYSFLINQSTNLSANDCIYYKGYFAFLTTIV